MKSRGFSLIELMIVLILISLSTALVMPSLSRFLKTVELKTAAKKVSGILRYCRSEAINKGQVYQVLFDSNSRQMKVQTAEENEEEKDGQGGKNQNGRIYALPEGIQIEEIEIPSTQYANDLPTIEFYPNGGSNGGSFFLRSEERKGYRIRVHFLTGMVKIEQ